MSGAAAAAYAAKVRATRALGVIVAVEPSEFLALLQRQDEPLVVHATGGILSTNYQYLVSHKGLAFFTKSNRPLALHPGCEVVQSRRIWIPG